MRSCFRPVPSDTPMSARTSPRSPGHSNASNHPLARSSSGGRVLPPPGVVAYRASIGSLPQIVYKVLESWKRYRSVERPWLYGVIGRTVQERIREHCYPKLTIFTRSGNPSGWFGLGYGFYNLLGAVWLQVAW